MKVYTLKHTELTLIEPPIGSGGEGAVYKIQGYPRKAAKIYHDCILGDPAEAKKYENKIMAMIDISKEAAFINRRISEDIAWPLSPLYDENNRFVGFGMNCISADGELDDLYAYPPERNTPCMTEKVDILINLCDVIGRLHSIGQVFGDFNPNNIRIRTDRTVCFVDADSYHIRHNGKEYRCTVCFPGYMAPELIRACKGTTFEACPYQTFTEYTDRFSLAIHIFRILMNGCHPYTCAKDPGVKVSLPAVTAGDRVERGETVFFKVVPNYTAPPYTPDVEALPPYIRRLFERAFVAGHTAPDQRPGAEEWKQALMRYRGELRPCGHGNKLHAYWNGYHTCPYCEADSRYRNKIQTRPFIPAAAAAIPAAPVQNSLALVQNPPAGQAGTAASSAPPPLQIAGWFWFLTIAMSVGLQLYLGICYYPREYEGVFESPFMQLLGSGASAIAGVWGSIYYNRNWCGSRFTGKHRWWEFLLSLASSLVTAVLCTVIILLAGLTVQLGARVFVSVMVILFLVGCIMGG